MPIYTLSPNFLVILVINFYGLFVPSRWVYLCTIFIEEQETESAGKVVAMKDSARRGTRFNKDAQARGAAACIDETSGCLKKGGNFLWVERVKAVDMNIYTGQIMMRMHARAHPRIFFPSPRASYSLGSEPRWIFRLICRKSTARLRFVKASIKGTEFPNVLKWNLRSERCVRAKPRNLPLNIRMMLFVVVLVFVCLFIRDGIVIAL